MSGKMKTKFKIKLNKLWKGEYQLGAFINFNGELYIYICLIKWNISIGFMC